MPISFEGLHYKTIEHVFQAKKIAIADETKAFHFSLESGHKIGQGDGAMAQKHRKYAKLDDEKIELLSRMSSDTMRAAALALYSDKNNVVERSVLIGTRDAQLFHIQCRKPPVRFVHLDEIRQEILL